MKDETKSQIRFVGRYIIAAALIPVGVAIGVGGLVQNWSRRLRGWERRSPAEPIGVPEGSGLREMGSGS
jgi:hypothetical protein